MGSEGARSALFSGTEPPPDHLRLDEGKLAAYLSNRLDGFGRIIEIAKFKGGQSNPTYRITTDEQSYVLRRRPPGPLVKSAHAVDREFRVISALHDAGFPIPRPYLHCLDEDVIGSEFYVAQFVQGRVFWDAELPGMTPADRSRLYDDVAALFARLHSFDFAAAGLADFGRTSGYAARNLERWSTIYAQSALIDIPDMDWLADALRERLPATGRTALIHGDYGLYNIIVDSSEPRILAVLDWEMATLGDPLIDLAHHLRPWWEPRNAGLSATTLAGLDLPSLGIPTMDAYIASYSAGAGLSGFPDRQFYLAFAQFRYAAMIQGILKRVATGTAANRMVPHRQERVVEIAALARHTLDAKDVSHAA